MAYELIETVEVGAGGASSIEFTSIPQDGVDLLLLISPRTTRVDNDDQCQITFNSDTGGNYTYLYLNGSGSAAYTSSTISTAFRPQINAANNTANTFSNLALYVSNYTSSTDKSCSLDAVQENNATAAIMGINAYNYATSSAISSIQLDAIGDYVQHSTASLYKIS